MSSNIVQLNIVPGTDQRFVQELGGVTYNFRLMWNNANDTWHLDIGDDQQNIILAGLPLVTGADLLGQYRHLGFTGGLVVTSDRNAGDAPTYTGLGESSHVFFIPD